MQELQETRVQSLGLEDPLEEGIATYSSMLAWRILWTGAWWAIVHGAAKSRTRLSDFTFTFMVTFNELINISTPPVSISNMANIDRYIPYDKSSLKSYNFLSMKGSRNQKFENFCFKAYSQINMQVKFR